LERALKRFEGQVQLVLYYPFAFNPPSEAATQAALCAGEQGKFWEFHQTLYLRQTEWSQANDPLARLQDMAKTLQVDPGALRSCVQSKRMLPLIEADRAYARGLQIRSTPTLFINDKRIVGAESEGDLVRTIRQELERARRPAQ
jgi:protein-disulfide isomerase